MGTYVTYEWVDARVGHDLIVDLLSKQLTTAGEAPEVVDTQLKAYVEEEIVEQIDSRINAACVKQTDIPVPTTNPSFAMLRGIARALLLREVYAHSSHDEIPPKIENAYVDAVQQLSQIQRGLITFADDGDTGPGTDGSSLDVSVLDSSGDSWDEDLYDTW